MTNIESKSNSLFKDLKKLKDKKKYREEKKQYIIEGFRFVKEAIKSNSSLDYIIITEEFYEKEKAFVDLLKIEGLKIIIMSRILLDELCDTENPQGIIAVVKIENSILKTGNTVILVDKVQDPGNMGTIIRTAHAVGARGVIITKGTVDVYNDKVLRSSMGSIFYVPIIEDYHLDMVKDLRRQGYRLLVSSLQGENNFFEEDLKGNIIIAVGNEGNGVSDEVYEISDIKVKIPMPGNSESLNVAIATSVMMYEKLRQDTIK
ncbi:MAG: RNA methyltransferase [Clostridium perfringens]|nr:RNA methyltransferase [Clostridium perfringens]